MDITPHTNLLRSLRGERKNYVALIGEGVDNAFDAGASAVEVFFTEEDVTFKDDGVGITRDRIGTMFSIGDHGNMVTTQLGRFGVGIKSQAVNAGNTLYVQSTSRDGQVKASAHWPQVLKGHSWIIDDPVWMPVLAGAQTGTTIIISDLLSTPKINIDRVTHDIAVRFHPAIAGGKTIVLNGRTVDAIPEPRLTDVVDCNLSLSDGRGAHLRGGILAEPSKLSGVHVAFGHRVIMPGSALGCDGYSGLRQMFARLQLSGPWRLAKFKDDLPNDDEREELEQAVLEALTPILEKCTASSMSAKLHSLADLLNDSIPPELAGARRPKREKERGKKSKKANKNGFVEVHKSTPDGPAKSKKMPRDMLTITFDGVAEEDGVGSYQVSGKLHRVNLAKDHPYIAGLIEHRDEKFATQSLLVVALAIFEEGRQTKNPELPFESFGQRISKHLSIQNEATEAA